MRLHWLFSQKKWISLLLIVVLIANPIFALICGIVIKVISIISGNGISYICGTGLTATAVDGLLGFRANGITAPSNTGLTATAVDGFTYTGNNGLTATAVDGFQI